MQWLQRGISDAGNRYYGVQLSRIDLAHAPDINWPTNTDKLIRIYLL
ncbi:tail fiber assembly protein [Dickeya dianthicola]|nr:tail fiber assembly protein [Dickeya dianthicola]MZI88409.1 tail fiber assembly protein [Dickeya dianthicola]